MKNYRIHLIRHGQTDANRRGEYVGRTDYDLCAQGIRDLLELRDSAVYPQVDRVYCSPLGRCIQTAGVLYPGCQLDVAPGFVELDFGDFEGKTYEELKDREDFRQWLQNSMTSAPPGGEDGESFMARIVSGLQQVLKDMMEESLTDVAVITHGGVIMTLLHGVGLPKAPFGTWRADNGQGFTLVTSTAMWMRDRAFEIMAPIPQKPQPEDPGELEEDEEEWEDDE